MRKLLTLWFSICLFSCIGDNPGTKAFTGTWRSVDGARLQLNDDGTFNATAMPAVLFFKYPLSFHYDASKIRATFNGSGHWFIRKWMCEYPDIHIEFDHTSLLKSASRELYVSGQGIWAAKPPWNTLFIEVSANSGERYNFIRQH